MAWGDGRPRRWLMMSPSENFFKNTLEKGPQVPYENYERCLFLLLLSDFQLPKTLSIRNR